MNMLIDAMLYVWDLNSDYAQRLVKDLSAEQMVSRCVPESVSKGLLPNHPAWVLAHLTLYHPIIVAALTDQTLADPKDHPFGMNSKPLLDASAYPSKDELIGNYVKGHEQVKAVLKAMDTRRLDAPPVLERWRPRFANQGIWLNYLMVYHESLHLGQISTWRRVQGLGAV